MATRTVTVTLEETQLDQIRRLVDARQRVVTSDPADLHALDPTLETVAL